MVNSSAAIARFARLERVLAFVITMIPAVLILGDGGRVRGSVSAYYSMGENQIYYFSLTVAAMLYIVNGVVKKRHAYNTILGVCLAGVILFNHSDFDTVHFIFAIAFFLGNAVAIGVFTSKRERWLKLLMVAAIILPLVASNYIEAISLFWAEWFALVVISLHYILESAGTID